MEDRLTSIEMDALSRNRIVSDMETNFFVEAGAGSGKTTMLVNRMVAMVEAGIDISKICAITFTKAAAGEFYKRFQERLIERKNPDHPWKDEGMAGQLPEPNETTRERCAHALQNIDLCFMGTIDAFCNMVLSEHPYEAGILSNARLISSNDAEAFYRQQYVKICDGEYGKELMHLANAFRAWHRSHQDVFVQGITLLMDNRNVTFHYDELLERDIDKEFADERKQLCSIVKFLIAHPELQYSGNKDSREAWEKIEEIFDNIKGRWSYNLSNVLYGLKALKKLRVIPEALKSHGLILEPVMANHDNKCLEITAAQDGGVYDKLIRNQYNISMTFLAHCVPKLQQAMRDKGYMTFFDYLFYLRNLLKADAEEGGQLIRYIRKRHRYFLIDEFQDTNPMQAEVFFYLSTDEPEAIWSECLPEESALFIVGDPKQSIYRFRSADVPSFLKVKALFGKEGMAVLSLSRNFRSANELCDYFNKTFRVMMPEETKDQSKFEEIPPARIAEKEFQGVFFYRSYTGKAAERYPNKADPVKIADIIEMLVDRDDYMITAKDDEAPRPIRYSDFMVIAYGKYNLAPIMAQIEARGIPVKVEGNVPFGKNDALCEVHRLYAAIAAPEDKIALYGALTGRLIALSNEELLRFKLFGGSISLLSSIDKDKFTDKAALRVCEKLEMLGRLQTEALGLSPAALFSRIMDDFRIFNITKADNMEVLYYTLELLRNAEKSGLVVSLKDGSDYISSLVAGETEEERCLSLNDNKDCVHLANLHKVKGLEAPIVILAAARNSKPPAEIRITHEDNRSEGYILSIKKKGGNSSYFETNEYNDEKDKEKDALSAEAQRLMYVAATRARNALIISERVEFRNEKKIVNTKWKPLLTAGIPDIFNEIKPFDRPKDDTGEIFNAEALYDKAEKGCVLNEKTVEEATYNMEAPSRQALISKVERPHEDEAAETPVVKEEEDDMSRFSNIIGTVMHKLMEMLVSAKGMGNPESMAEEILQEFCTPTIEPHKEMIKKKLCSAADRIIAGGYPQSNGLPQDILGTLLDADEVYCEVPFCYREDGAGKAVVWNGIMDVVYLFDGKWHIVDYKTNADGTELDAKYRKQLEAYEKAFKETTGHDAVALTYHIDV